MSSYLFLSVTLEIKLLVFSPHKSDSRLLLVSPSLRKKCAMHWTLSNFAGFISFLRYVECALL